MERIGGINVHFVFSSDRDARAESQALEAQNANFRVTPVAEETSALEGLEAADVDCVVLEGEVMERAGPLFLEQLRETLESVPIIFYGEHVEEALETDRFAEAVTDYVPRDGGADRYSLLANRIENAVTRTNREKRVETSEQLRQELTDIAVSFLKDPGSEIDRKVSDALERIGDLADADRSYVFQIDDGNAVHNTHEWCAQGVEPQIETNQGLTAESLPWLLPQLQAFETVAIPAVEALPTEAETERAIFDDQNIDSLLLVPMESMGDFVGFIGFDWISGRSDFSPDVIDTLELVGELIANALTWESKQQRLQAVTERWTLAQRAANLGVWDWDLRTDEVTFSENWVAMLGYDLEDIQPTLSAWQKRVHPEDLDAVEAALETHLAGESAFYESDHRMQAASGDWLWTKSVGKVVERDADGSPIRAVGIQQDISEQKARQLELEKSHETYQALFDGINDAVFVHDPDGTFLAVNETACERMGYTEAELLELRPADIDAPGHAEFAADRIERITSEGTHTFESVHVTKSGDEIPVEVAASTIEYFGKRAVLSVARDITERKERTRQLRYYKNAIDSSTDILVAADRDRRILFANKRFQQLIGVENEDPAGKHLSTYLSPEEYADVEEHFERGLAGETGLTRRKHRMPTGETRTLSVNYYPLRGTEGAINGVVAALRDITEQKEREKQLKRFEKASEAAGQAIYITDTDGTIEYVNPAFEEITGYDETTAIGRTPRLLKSDEMDEAFYEELWDTILDGKVWEDEIINERATGETYHAQQTVAPITDEAGEIEAFVAIQADITELKTKLAQVEQLSEYRRVMSEVNQQLVESKEPSVVLPQVAETVASSDQFSRAIIHREGKEPIAAPDDWATDPLGDLDTQAYLDAVYEVGTLPLENVTEPPFQQLPGNDPAASGFGFALEHEGQRFGALTVHLPAGEPASEDFLGLIEELAADIGLFLYTRRIEGDLRTREERLDLALEGAELGIWDWDMETDEVYRDDRYARMLGYDPAELQESVGAWEAILHPDGRETHDEALADHLEGEADLYQCEYRLRTANDEWKWIRNIGKVLEWEDGEPKRAVGVHQDIDEQKRTRERLRSNNELLQAIDRVLRHNLNNKMNIIQGYAETIAKQGEGAMATQAELIRKSGRSLLETTDKERRIMDIVAEPQSTKRLPLAPMLRRVSNRVRDRYQNATIELDAASVDVLAIPSLEAALEELIENGIEHADQSAPTVSIRCRRDETSVTVTVGDDGPGLPEMEQNVLTGTDEITPLYHGSGLGLWLINLIVQRSDGEISVSEPEAGGSRITIRLPIGS